MTTAPDTTAVLPQWRRLGTITALNLVSDIGYSFLIGALTTILLARGVAPAQVAIVSLIGMIYFARFLVGPLIDRLSRYRTWLVATQILLVALFVGLSRLDPVDDLGGVLVLTAAIVIVSVLHDTALGGLSVRLLEPGERGPANGLQVAGASVSILVGAGAAVTLYTQFGWTATVLGLAAVFAVPLTVLATLREPHADVAPEERARPWVGFFARRRVRGWTLFVAPLLALGVYLVTAIQPAMLVAAGWSLQQIAAVQFGIGPVAGAVVGVVAGVVIGGAGRRRSLLLIGLLTTAAIAATLPLSLGGSGFDAAAVLAVAAAYAAMGTWIATTCMDLARSGAAATDLALQTTVLGVLRMATSAGGLLLVGVLGFPALVAASLVLALAGTGVALRWMADR